MSTVIQKLLGLALTTAAAVTLTVPAAVGVGVGSALIQHVTSSSDPQSRRNRSCKGARLRIT